MKKKLTMLFSSLALLLVMIATLCSCSTYGSVKRAYEKKGWKENEDAIALQSALLTKALGEDYESACTVHALKKEGTILNYVIILEFDTTKEMNEKIEDSETLKGIIKDAQNSDYVSGTCILLFHSSTEGKEIFVSTK